MSDTVNNQPTASAQAGYGTPSYSRPVYWIIDITTINYTQTDKTRHVINLQGCIYKSEKRGEVGRDVARHFSLGSLSPWRARGARGYNGGLGVEPPAGSRGRAPGQKLMPFS